MVVAAPQVAQVGNRLRLADAELLSMLRTMTLVRAFERRTEALFKSGAIRGTAHSCIGQEGTAAAVCARLRSDDFIASTHRGHGHCIAKGATVDRMMAELFGRATGTCGGLGGSMHIADMDLGIVGANGIVGASLPLGAGTALYGLLQGQGQVTVAFFGDGAANEGAFHEAANLAAIWRLPLILFCENNQYALTAAYRETTAVARIADRAAAYGMPGVHVDGNDVAEIASAVDGALERARAGEGPTLIEAMTYRWGQHSMRANLREPRPAPEMELWKAKDPLLRVKRDLQRRGALDEAGAAALEAEAERAIDDAVAFAEASPPPDRAAMVAAVVGPRVPGPEPARETDRRLSFPDAIAEALAQEMERDERVFVMGEDVGATGGIFGATRGLHDRFGPARVRDTPISEGGFVTCAVGAALAGLRPVVELQFFDFVTLAMDGIVNQAAKMRFMLGGAGSVPLVIRGPQGGGLRLAAQHSQSLEAWFTHVPGLTVLAPATPFEAKGLLTAAIRDDNPTIVLEHKLLYVSPPGPVPAEPYAIPIGKGDIKRAGRDVTVVATMAMVSKALAAADLLARDGISVEVIDPRTLAPLDEDMILSSVRRTHRLLVVQEAWGYGGFASEVCTLAVTKAFDWLDAPPARLTGLDVPMPYNGDLERLVIPQTEGIVAAVDVLAQEDPARVEVGQHLFERHALLLGRVAAVVDQDVDRGLGPAELPPELAIALVPDQDLGVVVLVDAAGRLDVDPRDLALVAEILAPHRQAAAAVDAHLDDVDGAVDELGEVALVDLEVVGPLDDPGPDLLPLDVVPEGVADVPGPGLVRADLGEARGEAIGRRGRFPLLAGRARLVQEDPVALAKVPGRPVRGPRAVQPGHGPVTVIGVEHAMVDHLRYVSEPHKNLVCGAIRRTRREQGHDATGSGERPPGW